MILSDKMDAFEQELVEKTLADYREFREYQTRVQQTLGVFHQICIRNGIRYYLGYGSLLGAVRDNGQIPWDYDIDVWVPYEQADMLIRTLERELPEDYYFVTRLHDPSARHNIMRITPVGYDSEVIHVDVFWLTAMDADEAWRETVCRKMDRATRAMQLRYCSKAHLGVTGRVAELKYELERLRLAPITDEKVDKLFHDVMRGCQDSPWITDNFFLAAFRTEWFGEPKRITIASGQELCVPQEPEEILKLCYGDYTGIPALESRVAEYQMTLNRMRQLGIKK